MRNAIHALPIPTYGPSSYPIRVPVSCHPRPMWSCLIRVMQRTLTSAVRSTISAFTRPPPYYFNVALAVLVVLETLGVVGSIYYAQSGEI